MSYQSNAHKIAVMRMADRLGSLGYKEKILAGYLGQNLEPKEFSIEGQRRMNGSLGFVPYDIVIRTDSGETRTLIKLAAQNGKVYTSLWRLSQYLLEAMGLEEKLAGCLYLILIDTDQPLGLAQRFPALAEGLKEKLMAASGTNKPEALMMTISEWIEDGVGKRLNNKQALPE